MRLDALLPRVRQDPGYQALRERLARPGAREPARFSVLDAAKPAVVAALHGELDRPTFVLVNRLARARQVVEELRAWGESPDGIYLFPELDALPYERMPLGGEILAQRLQTLMALSMGDGGWGPGARTGEGHQGPGAGLPPVPRPLTPLVVVTARAAMDRVMSPEECREASQRVRRGDHVRPEQLVAEWVRTGYEPVAVVQGPGEFARRGGILDVYPVGLHTGRPDLRGAAFRIEFFGNEVDSIRAVDVSTQRSTESVEEVVIGPAHEVLPTTAPEAALSLDGFDFRHMRPRFRDEVEDEVRMLQGGQPFALLEAYRGLLGSSSILDYLPEDGLLIVDEPGVVAATARELHRQAEELYLDLRDRGEAPGGLPRPYRTWEELQGTGDRGQGTGDRGQGTGDGAIPPVSPRLRVSASPQGVSQLHFVLDPDALDTAFVPAPMYSGRLPELIDATATGEFQVPGSEFRADSGAELATRNSELVVIVSQQAARLAELFEEGGVRPSEVDSPGPLALVHGALGEGWANPGIGITVLTDREIFGWAKIRRTVRRAVASARERFLSDLEPGELVVHVDHGIGRYHGLVRIKDRGTDIEREYIDIEYADNGRLRVLAEHADRVSRYIGAGEAVPALTRLGSGEWQRTKRRIRSAVHRIARDLVELYATRELAEATPLAPDSQWQMELEASFPFLETPDQLQAAAAVKEDLEQKRPMDRLLVGDVGYGKTEVAVRAAFKAVNSGKQVGILVPTTVLAQQHFTTFRERLAPFPVRVEVLSRFLSDREARRVIGGIKDGTVDIVIGTHRLLQKDVGFRNLGLVIIDEEQRFGVAHKERFKHLRTEVHVLTLSATPIPRTLHLSLVGVRDLSMMQTPPEDRLPIRTYVTEHDDGLIREAILRELDRGGQVYYVSNRVYSILGVAARLAALVPEARIVVGHGQMSDDELEEAMLRFANGDADVLVCTTIIEAGLDLPNVNTIVVTNAHQFGLSQLYQLRGRVGRGANRAYAYFLYAGDRQLSEIAEKRLRAIFEATELGAGYRIALKDLEIRGAGNLLGVEQHGHISAVGFDLYVRLLGEAVEQLKRLREQAMSGEGMADRVLSGALQEKPHASITLPLSASLPEDYVADEAARLNLYRRLAAIQDGPALGELISEMEDRFGSLPEPAMNLAYVVSLRLAAVEAGVEEISVEGGEIVVRFRAARSVDAVGLQRELNSPIRARANQVRMQLGRGMGWTATLRDLVDRLKIGAPSRALAGAAT